MPRNSASQTGGTVHSTPSPSSGNELLRVGWREWVALPQFNIRAMKVKVDTGARTSALHAYSVERVVERGTPRVRFMLHPLRFRTDVEVNGEADVIGERWVSDSGGHREKRLVIATDIVLGAMRFPIELTITDRDTMRFRMLLGRNAIRGRLMVDPSTSYRLGRPQLPRRSRP